MGFSALLAHRAVAELPATPPFVPSLKNFILHASQDAVIHSLGLVRLLACRAADFALLAASSWTCTKVTTGGKHVERPSLASKVRSTSWDFDNPRTLMLWPDFQLQPPSPTRPDTSSKPPYTVADFGRFWPKLAENGRKWPKIGPNSSFRRGFVRVSRVGREGMCGWVKSQHWCGFPCSFGVKRTEDRPKRQGLFFSAEPDPLVCGSMRGLRHFRGSRRSPDNWQVILVRILRRGRGIRRGPPSS